MFICKGDDLENFGLVNSTISNGQYNLCMTISTISLFMSLRCCNFGKSLEHFNFHPSMVFLNEYFIFNPNNYHIMKRNKRTKLKTF
jgi:hypothetical protein